MRQQTLADASFERYRKPTRRERFLAEMEQVIPWRELCGAIEPFYPKAEGARPADRRAGTDAAHPFSATLVQPVGSGGGRSLV